MVGFRTPSRNFRVRGGIDRDRAYRLPPILYIEPVTTPCQGSLLDGCPTVGWHAANCRLVVLRWEVLLQDCHHAATSKKISRALLTACGESTRATDRTFRYRFECFISRIV